MLDHNMQQAYLDSFRYDDSLLPLDGDETAFTPRMGDNGVLYIDYLSDESDEMKFHVRPMPSGLPVIEAHDRETDSTIVYFFDEIVQREGMGIVLYSRGLPNM